VTVSRILFMLNMVQELTPGMTLNTSDSRATSGWPAWSLTPASALLRSFRTMLLERSDRPACSLLVSGP
jgi:hypothetical protein